MTPILTLVMPKDSTGISDANRALAAQGIFPQGITWLAKGQAMDVRLSERPDVAMLRDIFCDIPVDWALQDEATRAKALLLSDMDSTMIQQECIDELAAYAGIGDEIKAITERAMQGEMDFETALAKRVSALKGLHAETLADCFKTRIQFSPGARTLIQTMKKMGMRCVLVSGGFTHFTEPVAQHLGFHTHFANRLDMENDCLTGGLEFPIFGAQTKLEILEMELAERGLIHRDVIAVGDGANDIPMLEAAGLGVAYKAKPIVKKQASAWIDHTDLTTILFFMGLPAVALSDGE